MRDEKEERKKQARSNKQTRQSNTAHPRQSLFLEKMSCLRWDSNPRHVLYTLDRALYQLSYRGSSAGWAQHVHVNVHDFVSEPQALSLHNYRYTDTCTLYMCTCMAYIYVHVHLYTNHIQDFFQEVSDGGKMNIKKGVKVRVWSMGVANYPHPRGQNSAKWGGIPSRPPAP